MKVMKKVLCVALAVLMLAVGLTACKKNDKKDQTDMEYVKEKGKLVVGITDFAPMDYQDADGNWIGFDADLAKAFAKKLGVEVEFQVIEWDNKAFELESKAIDVVWNGMTITDKVKAAMDCSNAYCNNQQIVIVKKDVADQYTTKDSVKGLKFAVEEGSAEIGRAHV